ncbi:hypothetical protein WG902_14765 [Ramlibacter sp. PS3R-8]|uniref:hypothetical protein n=1 Tax=Ramlibacter sp. PS3R-8 TaxID=3133437 RepID=UPI0030ACEFFC
MSSTRGGGEPDDNDSWAAESLPMSVRKELLERELQRLGFRKPQSHGAVQQQQQPQSSSHPNADADSGQHGE